MNDKRLGNKGKSSKNIKAKDILESEDDMDQILDRIDDEIILEGGGYFKGIKFGRGFKTVKKNAVNMTPMTSDTHAYN